jgi:hypothetical protein
MAAGQAAVTPLNASISSRLAQPSLDEQDVWWLCHAVHALAGALDSTASHTSDQQSLREPVSLLMGSAEVVIGVLTRMRTELDRLLDEHFARTAEVRLSGNIIWQYSLGFSRTVRCHCLCGRNEMRCPALERSTAQRWSKAARSVGWKSISHPWRTGRSGAAFDALRSVRIL